MQKNQNPFGKKALNDAFTDLKELCDHLEIKLETLENPLFETQPFPLKIPRSFADRIEKGNPNKDPILRQILPVTEEFMQFPNYSSDPVGDLAASPTAGVIHKYFGRAGFTHRNAPAQSIVAIVSDVISLILNYN